MLKNVIESVGELVKKAVFQKGEKDIEGLMEPLWHGMTQKYSGKNREVLMMVAALLYR